MKILTFFVPILFVSEVISVAVDTKLGRIEGQLSKSTNGQSFSSFAGIPFAKAPVGELRFKKPVPVEPWSGTLKADKKVECIQNDALMSHKVIGVEDCLVVNVYVPGDVSARKNDDDLLPVMFWIHGGGFFIGSGNTDFYGPERFMDYGVILVTTNYRLGPLGFMSTSNDDLPANLGLWDQTLALRWVQNNIKDFGGDPKKVTIFGESAGSMSVMYHYISPQSKGLFRAAIAQSGSSTSSFVKVDKNPVYYARSLAEKVGCDPKAATASIVQCLRTVDAVKIQEHVILYQQLELYPNVFKPYIDDFNSDPFLPKDPWQLIESGEFNDVPLILGNNKDEGLMTALNLYYSPALLEETKNRWHDEIGPLYVASREWNEVDAEVLEMTKEVSRFAFPDSGEPTYDTILTGFKDLISDTIFNAVGSITARKIARKSKSPIYEYLYKHMGTIGFMEFVHMKPWKMMLKYFGQLIGLNLFTPQHGVAHADELFMMFKPHMIPIEGVYTDEDKATSKNILKLWTDFAKTGNPTPDPSTTQWKRLSNESKDRLEIGSGTLEMNLDQELENRINFWTKIWTKYPLTMRLETSKSWSDPMLYGPTNKSPDSGEPKQEL